MIKFYNRKAKQYDVEKVAGEKYLNWTYSSPLGMTLLEALIKKKLFSKLYGWYCDTKFSRKKISQFINEFDLDVSIFKDSVNSYNCFNDFFTRKLNNSARPFNNDDQILISPGDGRLTVYENIDLNNIIQVKGITYSLRELINNDEIADRFSTGTCLILRLCPTDYHRFHFIDCGICEETIKIDGNYYSVNPIALNKIQGLFCKNKREWSIFHSKNFGHILHVEVGATCVGSIIQTYKPNSQISKGDEKGYFKFGGSTTILFFEKNNIKIDEDILSQSSLGYETQVVFGETIGHKKIL